MQHVFTRVATDYGDSRQRHEVAFQQVMKNHDGVWLLVKRWVEEGTEHFKFLKLEMAYVAQA